MESGAHAATNSLHSLAWPKEGILFPPVSMAMDDDMANGRLGPSVVPSLDIPGQVIVSEGDGGCFKAPEDGGWSGWAGGKAGRWVVECAGGWVGELVSG